MLLAQVKELLKQYTEEDLRLLICEMYKSIPKKIREDKEIDEMVTDIQAYKRIGKVNRDQNKKRDIIELKPQINQFIDFAYKQYYFAPNNYVHKKERPKWRFHVKAFIKDLESISIEGSEGREATNLLKRLYEMLSYGCAYYIFNTDNPFQSVGIEQTVLLDKVIRRLLGRGIDDECIKTTIELVINGYTARDTLSSSLVITFVNNLKTTDAKEMAIRQCALIKKELILTQENSSKKASSSENYWSTEKRNELTETVFRIYMSLCENEKAIKYFHDNHIERDKEISLYVLLHLLEDYECIDYWIKEYKMAQEKGIEPRAGLQREYNYILENKKFPDYWM